MQVYNLSLFFHILGVVTLLAGFAVHQVAGARARKAATVEHLRLWLGLAGSTKALFPIGSILILLSGLHMAGDRYTFALPWIAVGVATLVLFMIVGPLVQGRGYGAVGAAVAEAEDGPVSPDLARTVLEKGPWVALWAMNGVAVGLVWLMVMKPGWVGSIVSLVVLSLIGGVIGRVAVGRAAKSAAGEAAEPEAEPAHR